MLLDGILLPQDREVADMMSSDDAIQTMLDVRTELILLFSLTSLTLSCFADGPLNDVRLIHIVGVEVEDREARA